MNRVFLILLLLGLVMFSLTAFSVNEENDKEEISADSLKTIEKIDDWQLDFNASVTMESIVAIKAGASAVSAARNPNIKIEDTNFSFKLPPAAKKSSFVLGLSVGGAKDVGNFRLNIENGFLPQASSITYEGLFYDYYFDTSGISSETDDLFSPSYNFHKQYNPLNDEEETWLSVGLNSNLKESDFARKKLNLVVVLDISGSMNQAFTKYYYDNERNETENDNRTKMEIATETICEMLGHLKSEDRFGMVLFDQRAFLAKPMNIVGETDMVKIKEHILALKTQGSTNMYAGMEEGTKQFKKYLNVDKDEYENRIIFLTDAMPNRGLTDKNSLWGVLDENADKGLYTSVIGIGVDFQTRLIEHISKVEGANYYSVHSEKEFKRRLDDEFEFMVTPMLFNLNMVIDAEGYEIKRVCGTPYSSESNGEIMKVGTLFLSASKGGEVKGGIILVEMQKTSEDGEIYLLAGYDDRNGKHFQNRMKVDFRNALRSTKISTGLQKGVLLVHYADLLQEWVGFMRGPDGAKQKDNVDDWQYLKPKRHPKKKGVSKWEQKSIPLAVNNYYRKEFREFRTLLKKEKKRLKDRHLQQEVELLELLINQE